jgi:phage gpG-like protein
MAKFDETKAYLKKIENFLRKDVPVIIGTEAVNHYHENFVKQGFDGKKWKNVKRRDSNSTWLGFEYGAKSRKPAGHPSRADAKKPYKKRKDSPITNFSPTAKTRPILSSKRSNLENSIRFRVNGFRVTVYSDVKYAGVHNKGKMIKVFGKKSVRMPQRQFIGKSEILKRKIKAILAQKMKNL